MAFTAGASASVKARRTTRSVSNVGCVGGRAMAHHIGGIASVARLEEGRRHRLPSKDLRGVGMAERIDYGGIDHVQLAMPAGRENEARRFYADVLGLREVPKPAALARRGGCWFASSDGRVQVHLGIDPDFRPARKAHPAFTVGDLRPLRWRLADAGVDVVEDDAIEVLRFYAADPFGNRIEFMEAQPGESAETAE